MAFDLFTWCKRRNTNKTDFLFTHIICGWPRFFCCCCRGRMPFRHKHRQTHFNDFNFFLYGTTLSFTSILMLRKPHWHFNFYLFNLWLRARLANNHIFSMHHKRPPLFFLLSHLHLIALKTRVNNTNWTVFVARLLTSSLSHWLYDFLGLALNDCHFLSVRIFFGCKSIEIDW